MGRDALTDMDRNPGDICEGEADERLSLESLKKVVTIAPLAAAVGLFVLLALELPFPLLLAPADPPVIQGATCCINEAAVEGGWCTIWGARLPAGSRTARSRR